MKVRLQEQTNFSSVFFDTLFGLVLFFNLDSLLEIKTLTHFLFYVFGMIILAHWWLIFKSTDDCFGQEVNDSVVDVLIGIVEVVLLEYIILYARDFLLGRSLLCLLALLTVDSIWALIWRFVGKWRTKKKEDIHRMEEELDKNLLANIIFLVPGILIALLTPWLTAATFVVLFITIYVIYMGLTFYYRIIDLDIF